jgi:hypothetical protein
MTVIVSLLAYICLYAFGEGLVLVSQRNVVSRPVMDSNLLQFSSTPGMSTYVSSFIPFVGKTYI